MGTTTTTTTSTQHPQASVNVFVTRDCVHFRPIPPANSPFAQIATRLFSLLRGTSEQSISARRAFAHCILDHSIPEPSRQNYSPAIDSQIKELFTNSPPMIACIQGANKVDFLHDNQKLNGTSAPKAVGNVANSPNLVQNASANINNGPTDLLDVLFFGWTLHNDMTRCKKEEPEQYARYCYFFLCSLVHETAHWLLTKIHGYRPDQYRRDCAANSSLNGRGAATTVAISQAGQSNPDYLIALGQRADDAGARATDMLVGSTSKVVSFADGDTDIVRRGFKPRISNEPAILSSAELLDIVGLKAWPQMFDVTGEAPILIGGPIPAWSTHDHYLVTSQVLVNSYCPHGITRIGQLFN